MARTSYSRLVLFAETLEPAIRDAFLNAIREARQSAALRTIAQLLEQGRVDDVMQSLGLDAARFSELSEAVRSAYVAGGMQGASEFPALRVAGSRRSPAARVRFDLRNPQAEAWLQKESSRLVTEVLTSQRDVIRNALSEGLAAGRNPRNTALNLVGRISETGRRAGGVIGLTSQQSQYVLNARSDLASGNPTRMARYFTRQRRDKRLDGIVRRAIKAGKPVSQTDIDRITGRYADRLLQLRGENIARSESISALNASRAQSYNQAIEQGLVRASHVRKIWSATLGPRTRDSHRDLNGTSVALNESFRSPTTGALMKYPGDTSMGAQGEDVVNCRCMAIFRVDMVAATLDP